VCDGGSLCWSARGCLLLGAREGGFYGEGVQDCIRVYGLVFV